MPLIAAIKKKGATAVDSSFLRGTFDVDAQAKLSRWVFFVEPTCPLSYEA